MKAQEILTTIGHRLEDEFEKGKTILSFDEFLELTLPAPYRYFRNSSQYFLDMLEYFGTSERLVVDQSLRHFNLFDLPFQHGKDRLVAQEAVQESIYKIVSNFTRIGRNNKLILLHGPNGSAKSTLVACLIKGLEQYSQQDEGKLYTFNWIFPTERLQKGDVGFGSEESSAKKKGDLHSYAHLPDKHIAATIPCELRDHPIFLLPQTERLLFLESILGPELKRDRYGLSDYILKGDLCHKCRQIYKALLNSYRGDFAQLLRHVQVERFMISSKYRESAITIEPQISVDAESRQITMDKSLAYLPPALQNISLFEPRGDLIDANRGILEYSDLLKRPLETYKYLLGTSEKGSVNLASSVVFLDLILIASANDKHLDAFKQIPDFNSFKGRIELIKVPYLLDYQAEKEIYDIQIGSLTKDKHLSPHTTEMAALWAVLTRMKNPDIDRFPAKVANIIRRITPIDKAMLYAHGDLPDLTEDERKLLRNAMPDLRLQGAEYPYYEGRIGASPREIQTILLNAAQNRNFRCLSPLAVMEELEILVNDPTVYEFLQVKPENGYYEHEAFIQAIRARYLKLVDQELRLSSGLIDESQYAKLFEKYIQNVSHYIKKEKIRNKITGQLENPDEKFMQDLEKMFRTKEDKGEFRNQLIAKIAAYSLEHPHTAPAYEVIFADLFRRLQEDFYQQRKETLRKIAEGMMLYQTDDFSSLPQDEQKLIEETYEAMAKRFGYCISCSRDAVSYLLKSQLSERK